MSRILSHRFVLFSIRCDHRLVFTRWNRSGIVPCFRLLLWRVGGISFRASRTVWSNIRRHVTSPLRCPIILPCVCVVPMWELCLPYCASLAGDVGLTVWARPAPILRCRRFVASPHISELGMSPYFDIAFGGFVTYHLEGPTAEVAVFASPSPFSSTRSVSLAVFSGIFRCLSGSVWSIRVQIFSLLFVFSAGLVSRPPSGTVQPALLVVSLSSGVSPAFLRLLSSPVLRGRISCLPFCPCLVVFFWFFLAPSVELNPSLGFVSFAFSSLFCCCSSGHSSLTKQIPC